MAYLACDVREDAVLPVLKVHTVAVALGVNHSEGECLAVEGLSYIVLLCSQGAFIYEAEFLEGLCGSS